MPWHPQTPPSLASFKSRLVLHFWCRLTQVVLEMRPLNGCSSSSSSICNTVVTVQGSTHTFWITELKCNGLHQKQAMIKEYCSLLQWVLVPVFISANGFYLCYTMLVRLLAMARCLSVCVYHKLVFCQRVWMNLAGFWLGSFYPPILHCVKRKFAYLQK